MPRYRVEHAVADPDRGYRSATVAECDTEAEAIARCKQERNGRGFKGHTWQQSGSFEPDVLVIYGWPGVAEWYQVRDTAAAS